MYINNIKIKNFRNIIDCNVNPDKKLNFLYGKNAQGKTNLIEIIYYSSFYKSFRTNKNTDLINIEKDNFNIDIDLVNNCVNNNLKISYDNKNNKKIIINNKKPNNINFYKIINSIIYYPDEISYLKTYPSYRRNLIDRSIFYINNDYIVTFKKYIKCLKQRNIFLKSSFNEHDIWKDQLIEYSYQIIKERINYLARINDYFYKNNHLYEKYSIEYEKYEKDKIKDSLLSKYEKYKNKEIKYGYTLVGPHVDDFTFLINNNDMNKYSSEGQKRSLLLSYKQAQLEDYKNNYGYYPILLFDDMGSELDSSRKNNIFYKILDNSGQIFLTTMDIPNIDKNNKKIFEVKNGVIKEFTFY